MSPFNQYDCCDQSNTEVVARVLLHDTSLSNKQLFLCEL